MIHANRSAPTSFERLRGGMTADLNAVVDDLDLLIRLTIRACLGNAGGDEPAG
jgi:hypothetical protein